MNNMHRPPDGKHALRGVDPAANQSNIDSITAELGRHAGDAGETKRLKTLDEKRLGAAASGGAKTRRGKAKHATSDTALH
jgi:hypothetical protein